VTFPIVFYMKQKPVTNMMIFTKEHQNTHMIHRQVILFYHLIKILLLKPGIIDGDKVKIRGSEVTYSVPVCDEENPFYANNECRPENTTEVDISCSEAKPYLVNGICVDPDTALSVVTDGCNEKTPYKKKMHVMRPQKKH